MQIEPGCKVLVQGTPWEDMNGRIGTALYSYSDGGWMVAGVPDPTDCRKFHKDRLTRITIHDPSRVHRKLTI